LRNYLTDQAAIWTLQTLKQRRVLLEVNVYPAMGDPPVNEISSSDTLRILQDIGSRALGRGNYKRHGQEDLRGKHGGKM
jgi:hypothetical protein